MVAPDHLHRHVDAVHPLVQIRVVQTRLPRQLGRHQVVLQHRVDFGFGWLDGERCLRELGVVEQVVCGLFAVPHKNVALLHALHVDAGRGDQDNRTNRAGVAHRHLGRDPAAERIADDAHGIEAEMLQEVEVEVGEVGYVVEPRGRVGSAESRMLWHDHVIALGELLHERHPVCRPARAMKEQQRLALAATHHPNPAPVDFMKTFGCVCH